MIRATCDRAGCPTTTETDETFRNPPDGWVALRIRGERELDYCSVACAVQALRDRAEAAPLRLTGAA